MAKSQQTEPTTPASVGKPQNVPPADPSPKESQPQKPVSPETLFNSIITGFGPKATDDARKVALQTISTDLKNKISSFACLNKYNLVVLFDSSTMVKEDADHIYNAVTTFSDKKPLLMILYSRGGVIGSAYLIGQLCREYSNGTFHVSVPRIAKSSATLLCCAADEIHMGSLSELGPIDPQIDQLPALGLKNSIEHIAQLVKKTPESAEMFAKYLHLSLKPIDLGYYERVAESALQYAERLLTTHSANLPRQAGLIANDLVYTYKDHGFVIDKSEAARIFGGKIVKFNTDEYDLGNTLYRELSFLENVLEWLGHSFYFIGTIDSEPHIRKRK